MRLSRAIYTLAAAVLLSLSAASVQGQSLLQRLEERIREAIPPAGGAPAPAPADGVPTPARPVEPEALPAGTLFQPGYLGLVADNLPERQKGVVVTEVRPGGPAEKGGVKVGDRITQIDLVDLQDLDDLELLLGGISAGKKIRLTIERGGKKLEVTPVMAARSTPADAPANEFPANNGPLVAAGGQGSLGLTVIPLTDEARARFGLTVKRGALISAVRAGTPADRAGIPVGGVVVSMDGRRIDTADELVEMIRSSRAGQEVELTYYNGDRLSRKTLRLAPAPNVVMAPPGGPLGIPTPGPAPGNDRPVLRALERIVGGIGNNSGGNPSGGNGGPPPVIIPTPAPLPNDGPSPTPAPAPAA